MKPRSDTIARLLAAATVVAVAGLMLTPVSARTPSFEAPAGWQPDADPAEDLFADAEFGVDPMVTGPVSEDFRQLQARLGCAEAKWPNIPAACYPKQN